MTLNEVIEAILATEAEMNRAFQRTVFDESALVARRDKRFYLVWYQGPRDVDFVQRFAEVTSALRSELRARFINTHAVGDFEFTPEGYGGQAEAAVACGEELFLILGNTALSMTEIARDPLWRTAQTHLLSLCTRFMLSPAVLSEPPAGPELVFP